MIVGSLIKNPGGGLAPIGGYIVRNRKNAWKMQHTRLTSPGLGKEVGASLGVNRSLSIRDFSLRQRLSKGALKGAMFAANIYEKLGFTVVPNGSESTS